MPTNNTTVLDCPFCALAWKVSNQALMAESDVKCPTCHQQIAINHWETREGIKYRVTTACDAVFYIPVLTRESFRRQLVRLAP